MTDPSLPMKESKQRDRKNESLFNEKILQNRNICDNCFTRVREVVKEFDDANLPRSLRGCLSDMTHRINSETVYHQSYSVSEGAITVCSRCETEDYIERKVRDLSREESREKAGELADRLREDDDVGFEDDGAPLGVKLYKEVKQRFSEPEYQSKDQRALFGDAFNQVAVRSGDLENQQQ